MSITLATHDDYLITLHHGANACTGPLVITFGGQPSKLTAAGFGTGWCLNRGWDTIYVAQRHGSQYQGLRQQEFYDAVASTIEGRDVVSYGSSLGGYAALYFGGAIDARIVAAAPLLPAWPPLERARDTINIRHSELAQAKVSSKSPIIIYDPMVRHDLMMVNLMVRAAYPDMRAVEVEDAGHTVLETLKASGLLRDVIEAAVNHDTAIMVTMDGTANPLWHYWRGKRLMRSDPEGARHHLKQSFELRPSRHVIGNLLSLLLRTQDLDAAQKLLDKVAAMDDPKVFVPEGNVAAARAAGLRVWAQALDHGP